MSVTFWAPDAPTETVKPYPEEEPDYCEERSTLPEINVSNANARALLQLMGLPSEELCGTLQPSEVGPVVTRLQHLLNDARARAPGLKATQVYSDSLKVLKNGTDGDNVICVGRGPSIIDGGRTDEYLERRVRALLELFVQARQANYCLSWG